MTYEQKKGKEFEQIVAKQFYADTNIYLERLPDLLNEQPCDYIAIILPRNNRPGINLFVEVKWSSWYSFPLSNIAPHQLESMKKLDNVIATSHAGFLICCGPKNNRQIWFIHGHDLYAYAQQGHTTLSQTYLEKYALPISYDFNRKTGSLHIHFKDFLDKLSVSRNRQS